MLIMQCPRTTASVFAIVQTKFWNKENPQAVRRELVRGSAATPLDEVLYFVHKAGIYSSVESLRQSRDQSQVDHSDPLPPRHQLAPWIVAVMKGGRDASYIFNPKFLRTLSKESACLQSS